jgi:deferrochelatase/peroxidase EfeB
MRNGTFMAYRKLHQNVKAFRDYVAKRRRPTPRRTAARRTRPARS